MDTAEVGDPDEAEICNEDLADRVAGLLDESAWAAFVLVELLTGVGNEVPGTVIEDVEPLVMVAVETTLVEICAAGIDMTLVAWIALVVAAAG